MEATLPLPQRDAHRNATIKGRGAISNIAHRFAKDSREAFSDGWETDFAQEDFAQDPGQEHSSEPSLKTQIHFEQAKSALVENHSPDLPFRWTINPYRGCEHGCIYCFARPTHSYLGYSPGLDFETQLIAKRNIAQVLAQELQQRGYRPSVVNIGGATDCYQPIERRLKLTRQIIDVFAACQHPFTLVTKSSLVERDLDVLVPLARKNLITIHITLTTLDGKLARILEPRAPTPDRRLRIIESLARAEIPVGVSASPQIPFINDDLEQVLCAGAQAGAKSAFYTVLRLPWEVAPLFQEWLASHYPDRAYRVMSKIAQMRGGKVYDSDFATRMKGSGLWAQLLGQRFEKAKQRYGLTSPVTALNETDFNPEPLRKQLSLF